MMNKKRKAIIAGNEISELYTFQLGGYEQKVLIEGKTGELPVVVTLHGGPGTPIPFSVGCRGLFPEFTNRFIMVYWDQLGCGINNHKIDERFTIESFVDMTADLLREIQKMFPRNKIYIFATSWGSILSAKVLERCGDIVNGVVACGQIIKEVFLNEEVFTALERSALPPQKLEIIKKMDVERITAGEMQLISSGVRKYTEGYVNKSGRKAPVGTIIRGLITSPDYSMKDFKAVMVNGYRNHISLWKEILKLDLSEALKRTKVPYMMIQGDTDIVASTENVKNLVESSQNPCLQYSVVKHTGHMPGMDMMDRVFNLLKEQTEEQTENTSNVDNPVNI